MTTWPIALGLKQHSAYGSSIYKRGPFCSRVVKRQREKKGLKCTSSDLTSAWVLFPYGPTFAMSKTKP